MAHKSTALVPDDKIEGAVQIPRNLIRPFKGQPREHFDPVAMQELATSIKEAGQWTPVTVRRLTDKERGKDPKHEFELVDGERRFIASGMAEKPCMRAFITTVGAPIEQFKMSFIMNLARQGHSTLEIAHNLDRLRTEDPDYRDLSPADQAKKLANFAGKSLPWVYQHLQILRLPKPILQLMDPKIPEKQRLGFEAAIFVCSLGNEELQLSVARKLASREMSPKQARASVSLADKAHPGMGNTGPRHKPSHVRAAFQTFMRRTNTDLDWLKTLVHQRDFQQMFDDAEPELRGQLALKARIAISKLTELADILSGNKVKPVTDTVDRTAPHLHRDRLIPHPAPERDINNYELTADETEFINALTDYKDKFNRRFPSTREMLHILKLIGYARVNGVAK